jgi:uncharacterized protein (TIGR03382 family)
MRSLLHLRGLGFIAAVFFGLAARAQSFPVAESSWTPLWCGTEVMTDLHRDESGALGERDLVGDVNAATGFRAADGQYLYLRARLDQDPMPGGNPRPFAWGLLLDTDGNLQTYEVLIMMNGIDETVSLYENTGTQLLNDPTDPPEKLVKTYSLASNGRSVTASGSSYGGDSDYFVDVAIPWQDLQAVGITPSTPVTAWAATSSTSSSLNGDFACWNDANGAPTLSGTPSGQTVLDPRVDSDNDGYTDVYEYRSGTDPKSGTSHPQGDPDARQLAGGGGCGTAGGASLIALGVAAAALIFRRRRASLG